MNYKALFTAHHLALLCDWLEQKRSLCVEVYHPHGGGSGSYFTVRSLSELKALVGSIKFLEVQITIWKNYTLEQFESEAPETLSLDRKWIYTHTDEVMYFSVTKNRNWSKSYADNPQKYAQAVQEWDSD